MKLILHIILILTCTLLSSYVLATEPLHDELLFNGKIGDIFPEKCCWMKLPESKKLNEIRKKEACSAIGGPVGKFKYEDGKLWLTSLFRCSGEIQLKEVYPDLSTPALATWLTGKFRAGFGYLCTDKSYKIIYESELTLTVDQGIVNSIEEIKHNIIFQCQ